MCITTLHKKKFILCITWFFLVAVLLFLPGKSLPKVDNWLIQLNFDKLVHLSLFAIQSYFFIRPIALSTLPQKQQWQYCIKITLASIVWGITTELIQKYFIPGRNFDFMDWAADSAGSLLALFFCKKYFKITTPHKR